MGCSLSKRRAKVSHFDELVHGRPIIQGHIQEENAVSINCGKIQMKINLYDHTVCISNGNGSMVNVKGYQPAAQILISSIRVAKNAESDECLHRVELYTSNVCILTFSMWNISHVTDIDIINNIVILVSSLAYQA